MSDEEWAFHERFILSIRAPNGRKALNHRLVLDGIFWIARTGSPWWDLPAEFGKWSSVYRQFRRWTLAGLWEGILEALNESGSVPDALQMIDSTVVRAHHQAAGANVWPAPSASGIFDDDMISLHKRIRHVGTMAAAKMEIRASRSS